MIIGINARILNTKSIRGWSRYACNLIQGLQKEGLELKLFSDQPINLQWVPREIHDCVYVKPGRSYIHWEQVILKQMAEEHKVDVLHCPINYGLPILGRFKKVLTLHDAIEKSFYGKDISPIEKLKFLYLKMNLYYWLSQRSADKIITVSEFSKSDIVSKYNINEAKISVIYEAADDVFSLANVKSEQEFVRRWKLTPGYLLYIGGFEERKNINFILSMAKQLPGYQFVLVGGGDIDKLSSSSSNVHFTGYVEESWLPSFYYYSKAFVYPSFHEGFGLQLVESMAFDKPCLYANTTCLPEIYGSGELGFDPGHVNQAVEKLKLLEHNYADAVRFVQSRRKRFSWEATIKETIELYHSLL